MSVKIDWDRAEREMMNDIKELRMSPFCDSSSVLLHQGAGYQVQLTVTMDRDEWIDSELPEEG